MEFGRAGKAGKILRAALRPLLTNVKSSGMASRMTQIMMKVIQADTVSQRGLRNVIDGEAELLTGFDFNQTGALATTIHAPYTSSIDRVTGEMAVSINPFVPSDMITAPQGTMHFKITSGGAEVDFEQERFANAQESTAVLPYSVTATTLITHTLSLPANSTKPLFLALGIEFFQDINGSMYALKNGSYNPLAIIKVDGGV